MNTTVKTCYAHLNDEPKIAVTEKLEKAGLFIITFSFPFPLVWYGDNYTYELNHKVTEVFIGESEEAIMEKARAYARLIINWENKRVSENIGTWVTSETVNPSATGS